MTQTAPEALQPQVMIYGLAHCDTVKKTRAWFGSHGVNAVFHDFKKQGLPEEMLLQWMATLGWQTLLNRRGTSWRKLTLDQQNSVSDDASAFVWLRQNSSLVKRPVVLWPNGQISCGFSAELFEQMLAC